MAAPAYRARNPGTTRDSSGVAVDVSVFGDIAITDERRGGEVMLTPLQVAVLLDGMLQQALTDAEAGS